MVETEVEFILAPFTFKRAFIATLPLPNMTNWSIIEAFTATATLFMWLVYATGLHGFKINLLADYRGSGRVVSEIGAISVEVCL